MLTSQRPRAFRSLPQRLAARFWVRLELCVVSSVQPLLYMSLGSPGTSYHILSRRRLGFVQKGKNLATPSVLWIPSSREYIVQVCGRSRNKNL